MAEAGALLIANGPKWGELGKEIPAPYQRPGGLKWAAGQWKQHVGLKPSELSLGAIGKLGKTMLQGWVEAKKRGIEMGGAPRDLGIMALCGAIAHMAVSIPRKLVTTVPAPDVSWIDAVFSSRQVYSAFPKDAATIIRKGKEIGITAANGFATRLGNKQIRIQARQRSPWIGTGLEGPEDDTGVVVSDCMVVYLLALKAQCQTRPGVYAHILQALAGQGIHFGAG